MTDAALLAAIVVPPFVLLAGLAVALHFWQVRREVRMAREAVEQAATRYWPGHSLDSPTRPIRWTGYAPVPSADGSVAGLWRTTPAPHLTGDPL